MVSGAGVMVFAKIVYPWNKCSTVVNFLHLSQKEFILAIFLPMVVGVKNKNKNYKMRKERISTVSLKRHH